MPMIKIWSTNNQYCLLLLYFVDICIPILTEKSDKSAIDAFLGETCMLSNSATATQYSTLQHTATHCNTLQLIATQCNTLQLTAAHCNTLQHNATHCNTLQHTATHCNTTLY